MSLDSKNAETMARYYERTNVGDFLGALEFLSEDVVYRIPGPADRVPYSGEWHGKNQVLLCFEASTRRSASSTWWRPGLYQVPTSCSPSTTRYSSAGRPVDRQAVAGRSTHAHAGRPDHDRPLPSHRSGQDRPVVPVGGHVRVHPAVVTRCDATVRARPGDCRARTGRVWPGQVWSRPYLLLVLLLAADGVQFGEYVGRQL